MNGLKHDVVFLPSILFRLPAADLAHPVFKDEDSNGYRLIASCVSLLHVNGYGLMAAEAQRDISPFHPIIHTWRYKLVNQ